MNLVLSLPEAPGPSCRRSFLDADVADGHEHGEREDAAPREDALVGTSGSHTPLPDTRAEEPFGETARIDQYGVV